jgi:hypothetical protein
MNNTPLPNAARDADDDSDYEDTTIEGIRINGVDNAKADQLLNCLFHVVTMECNPPVGKRLWLYNPQKSRNSAKKLLLWLKVLCFRYRRESNERGERTITHLIKLVEYLKITDTNVARPSHFISDYQSKPENLNYRLENNSHSYIKNLFCELLKISKREVNEDELS